MSNVKIKVNFYNESEKENIKKNFPEDFDILDKFDKKTIDVSLEDFKTYSYFRQQLTEKPKKFLDFRLMIKNWGHYDGYLKLQDDKLINIYPERIDNADVSEMLGVAGGLSVISKIYGFTQADWTRIPITTKHKDFDFKLDSCLKDRVIVLETKGSIVNDNSKKEPSVSNLKSNIIEKKNDKVFKNRYSSRNTCIGIITVADSTHYLQSWLVDPPVGDVEENPEKIKLLKRLYFYHSIFWFISKRSYLTVTLANRIKTIEASSDYRCFDKIPLLNHSFDSIQLTKKFINSHAKTKNSKIIGKVFFESEFIYFVGIEIDLIYKIIEQDFENILSLKSEPCTEINYIYCNISKKEKYINEMETSIIKNSAGLCLARESKSKLNWLEKSGKISF